MSFGNQVQFNVYQHIEKNIIPVSYEELEARAKELLDTKPYYYVAASAGAEVTATQNNRAFDKWQIVPRMLCDTSSRDLSVELFGKKLSYPLLLAPVGVQSIVHPDGELATARAAAAMDVPLIASTASHTALRKLQIQWGIPRGGISYIGVEIMKSPQAW